MLYLLDANVLITAHNTYYPIERVPEFWEWLIYHGENGAIKLPFETLEEVKAGGRENDPLAAWVTDSAVEEHLLLDEELDPDGVRRVV